jgi:hypothetical protein
VGLTCTSDTLLEFVAEEHGQTGALKPAERPSRLWVEHTENPDITDRQTGGG